MTDANNWDLNKTNTTLSSAGVWYAASGALARGVWERVCPLEKLKDLIELNSRSLVGIFFLYFMYFM